MKRADVGGYRHLIIIEDNYEVFVELSRIVKTFERNAATQSAVSYYRNYLMVG